ncbi:hypothetical protein Bca52824_095254, partial [Brassica carinata]
RQQAVTVGKERREAGTIGDDEEHPHVENEMMIDEEQPVLEAQTSKAVEERLLSKSEFPPIEPALSAGAVPLLVQFTWCLTNIAAGKPEETKALLPALPLLIAHLGELSAGAEQCSWAIGNVAGEGEDLRNVLLSQGALPPLARMIFPDKGSTVRTAAWALSNLIKGPESKAAAQLVGVDGMVDAILRLLKRSDEEIAMEIAWIVVYLSALSDIATSMLLKGCILQLLLLTFRIKFQKVHWCACKCLRSEHRVLKKEAAWVLSNIAAGSIEHKRMIHSTEAMPLLIGLLSTSPFDIRKEVAYVLGNLCVESAEGDTKRRIIQEHLVSIVSGGCLPGFINLVRSPDIEDARLGLQFIELVLRGMPSGEGSKLVEGEDGIDAMERLQFHESEELRVMANSLVDKYFGEDYGINE